MEERIMAGYYDRDRNPVGGTRTAAGQMNHAYAHHSSVAEYQASGIPFVHTEDASTFEEDTNNAGTYFDKLVIVNLPYVSRWVMMHVHDGSQNSLSTIRIGFGSAQSDTEGVMANNHVTTGMTNQVRMELKCKKVYFWIPSSLQGTTIKIEVIAGLTSVKDFPSTDERYVSGITSSSYNGDGVSFDIVPTHTVLSTKT